MGINLNNYEQYFLDHLEGNLSPEMEKELAEFLLAHPELREVLEEYDAVTIPPDESIIFHPKNSLKKNIHSSSPIDDRELEKMMISSIEGLLSEEEEAGLQKFLRLNPAKAKEMEAFRKTRIPVDPAIIYPYKSRLKRKAVILTAARLTWGIAATAAVILILLGIRIFNKVEESPVRLPVQTASEIPAVTPEATQEVTQESLRAESPKELQTFQDIAYMAVQENEQIEIESLERTGTYRIVEIQQATAIPGPKKYSIRRLKQRPIETIPTFEAKEPSLFAKLTNKVVRGAGQDIKENIGLDEIRKPRLNFWAVLSTGIKGYNKITDRELELCVNKNDEGKVSSYALIEQDRLILNRELNAE